MWWQVGIAFKVCPESIRRPGRARFWRNGNNDGGWEEEESHNVTHAFRSHDVILSSVAQRKFIKVNEINN
jgi:hypothetical protein